MKCLVCEENEHEYDYELINGLRIPICKECGEILYGKNIGAEYKDSRIQIILMMEYVKYIKNKTSKILRILPRRKASWNFFSIWRHLIVRRI